MRISPGSAPSMCAAMRASFALILSQARFGSTSRDDGASTSPGPEPVGRCRGVAVPDGHSVGVDEQLVRDNLGEGRFVPLALWSRANECGHASIWFDAYGAGVFAAERSDHAEVARHRRLGERDHAEPEVAPVASRGGLAIREACVVRLLQRLLQWFDKVAGRHPDASRRPIGQILGPKRGSAAYLSAVNAELRRDEIKGAFDDKDPHVVAESAVCP